MLILLLATAPALCAQQATRAAQTVSGLVRSASGEPVAGAYVQIGGTPLTAITDGTGRFSFTSAPAGDVEVRVVAVGYLPQKLTVRREATDQPARMEIVLERALVVVSPLVVTAARHSQLAEEAATSVSTAGPADILRRVTLGVDEAIDRIPGVQILDGQINVRGSSGYAKGLGSRVLLLVDGAPANQADRGGINWDVLPITEVERVEVLKGAGSALYGSSALGGVVNVITREIPDRPEARVRLLFGAYDRPSFPEWRWRSGVQRFATADFTASRPLGPVRALVSQGYRTNHGYRENSEDWGARGLVKLAYAPSPAFRADLYASVVTDVYRNALMWCLRGQCDDRGQSYQPFRVDSTTLGDRVRSDKVFVQASVRHVPSPRRAWRGRVSWFRTYFRQDFRSGLDYATAHRAGAEASSQFFPGPGRTLTAGLEANQSLVSSGLFGHHTQSELAAFGESEASLGGRAAATVGTRMDAIAVDGRGWFAVVSPRAGLVWRLPGARLRASAGRGFRAPSVAERFASIAVQGLRVIPNPNLASETSWSGEVGGTTGPLRWLVADAALFWTEYRNLIEPGLLVGSTQIQFRNVTAARTRGFDASLLATAWRGRLELTLAYTYLDGWDTSADRPLAFRSRHLATLGADLALGALALGMDARASSRPERVDIFESDRRVGARTVDFRASCRVAGTTFLLRLQNAFGYTYTLVPRTLEAPRAISVGVLRGDR